MNTEQQKNANGYSKPPGCRKFDRFPLWLKLGVKACLLVFGAAGVIAVFLDGWLLGVGYLLLCLATIYTTLRCHCAHCPYPFEYNDCLAMPPTVIRGAGPRKTAPFTGFEKTAFYLLLAGAMLIPQFSLFQRPVLLTVYWVFCLPTCFLFPFYICRRCRFTNCHFHP